MGKGQLINDTNLVVFYDEVLTKVGEKLLTVVKGTFELRRGATWLDAVPRKAARLVRVAEEHWGDPLSTPPKYPTDTMPTKAATDVIVVAKGYAPKSKPAEWFDVAVSVGPLHKTLRVFGLRAWQQKGAGLSAPLVVTEQEIRYDHAWGGTDLEDPENLAGDMRNPVGLGVVRDNNLLSDQLAPCIEDAYEPIRNASTKPVPAGFGPLGPHWIPRVNFIGTHDEHWKRNQAPLPPLDFDERHYQCASPGLVASPPLVGGEAVKLLNLTPGGGVVEFALPKTKVLVAHELREVPRPRIEPHIDTVIIDTLHVREGVLAVVEIVWRTLTTLPRRWRDCTIAVSKQATAAR